MQKSLFIIPMSLLVVSLMTPVRGFADDDDNGRYEEHHDLGHRAEQKLDKLRREGRQEIREHDRDDEGRDDNSREHVRRRDTDREHRDLNRDEHEHEHHDND